MNFPHCGTNNVYLKSYSWLSPKRCFTIDFCRAKSDLVFQQYNNHCLTFPVMADQTLSVLSSEPLTIRSPLNCRHVITWSSWPLNTFERNRQWLIYATITNKAKVKWVSRFIFVFISTMGSRLSPFLQLLSMRCCRIYDDFQEVPATPGREHFLWWADTHSVIPKESDSNPAAMIQQLREE